MKNTTLLLQGVTIMNDEFNISIEEVMKITHKSREFIINAIQQGTFPGSVDASGKRRNVHIPRKAFEDYMNHFNKSPSEELIIALLNSLNEKSALIKDTQHNQVTLFGACVASLIFAGTGYAQAKSVEAKYEEQSKQIDLYKDELNDMQGQLQEYTKYKAMYECIAVEKDQLQKEVEELSK